MTDYNNTIFKPRKDSGSYVEAVNPLWVRENKFKF